MDSKLLLVKSLTLLYRESQLEGTKEKSNNLVREIVSKIKPAEINLDMGGEQDIVKGLVRTVLSMCDDPSDHMYDQTEFLQQMRVNTQDDTDLYDSISMAVTKQMTDNELKRYCLNLHRSLKSYQREEAIAEIVSRAAYKLRFERDGLDMRKFVEEHYAAMEPYIGDDTAGHPAIVDEIDVDDDEAVEQAFKEVKDKVSGAGLLKTGYQGLNRMLNGGFVRGAEVVIGALQHKYKTGFSLSLFKQIALYNEPYMLDPTKKPLLVRISFEDSAANNFKFLYTSLYENKTRRKADLGCLTEKELQQYVKNELTVNGYSIKLLKIDPTQFTYRDIINKLLEYESDGYEIHLCMLDYLAMIPTTGCLQGAMGQDVRDLFRRMRNFTEPRKITLITPHQLSTEAKQKIRDGATNFVQQLVDGGFYDKCKTIDNEVDLELFIHIEKVNGRSYLTIQRGKDRDNPQTPLEYHYIVLPFEDIGGILDDINGEDTTRKKVGGGAIGANDETPFWAFEDAA